MGRDKASWGRVCAVLLGIGLLASVSGCTVERFAVGEDFPVPRDAGDAGLSVASPVDAGGAGGTVAADPCAAANCQPGMCRVQNGAALCVCPSGNVRDGLRCRSCTDTGNRITVVLPTRPVRVAINVNGAPAQPGARITFRNVTNLVDVTFGDLIESKAVPLGRYEVSYSGFVGQGFDGPGNRNHVLGVVDVRPAAAGESEVLVVSYALNAVRVTGTLDLGEDHPDVAPYVNLVFSAGESRVLARFLGSDRRAFEAILIPGNYEHGLSGSGEEAVVAYGATRFPTDPALNIRIAAHRVLVTLDSAGITAPTGLLLLRGKLGVFRLTRVSRGVYTSVVPEGDYVLEYALPGDGVSGPPLELIGAPVRSYRVTEPINDLVALKLVRARGRVTVNGKSPAVEQSVRIRSERLGSIPLRLDAQGAFDEQVFPGAYRLEYRCEGAGCREGAFGPVNRESLLGSVNIQEGTENLFDIPVGKVDLSVTERGQSQPGTISLLADDDGAWFTSVGLVESTAPSLAVSIVQNEYAVTYRRLGFGTMFSRVASLTAASFKGASALKASWDLEIIRVKGRIDVGPDARFRQFRLENPDFGYVSFEVDAGGQFEIDVPRASYLLRPGAGKQLGALGCFTISPP